MNLRKPAQTYDRDKARAGMEVNMLERYLLQMPQKVFGGRNALEYISRVVSDKNKVAVFTDQGIQATGLISEVTRYLSGKQVVIFDELPPEPTCDQVQVIADKFKKETFDIIIAVGGGSVMDIAKLASVMAGSDYTVRDLLENQTIMKKGIETLMIPTTAGTGSEATPNSIVAVPEKELKVGIVNNSLLADYVILDDVMIRKLPRKIAAATGLDALAHAIECFTSNKANPFSDTFALEALDLIFHNIERACDDPEAFDAKNAMLLGAFYAGVAITASGTTAVHALSYPLGGKYHIPHGVSNAMLLVPVMRFNESACRTRLAKAYDRIAGSEKVFETETEKSRWIIHRMDEIVKHLDIPQKLKEYGIGSKDIDLLVEAGMNVQRLLQNNMRTVTPEDARKLYMEIL